MAVDWRRPAYEESTVRRADPMPCDLCNTRIMPGDSWHRGPRGAAGVHASCRIALIAKSGAIERATPRPGPKQCGTLPSSHSSLTDTRRIIRRKLLDLVIESEKSVNWSVATAGLEDCLPPAESGRRWEELALAIRSLRSYGRLEPGSGWPLVATADGQLIYDARHNVKRTREKVTVSPPRKKRPAPVIDPMLLEYLLEEVRIAQGRWGIRALAAGYGAPYPETLDAVSLLVKQEKIRIVGGYLYIRDETPLGRAPKAAKPPKKVKAKKPAKSGQVLVSDGEKGMEYRDPEPAPRENRLAPDTRDGVFGGQELVASSAPGGICPLPARPSVLAGGDTRVEIGGRVSPEVVDLESPADQLRATEISHRLLNLRALESRLTLDLVQVRGSIEALEAE